MQTPSSAQSSSDKPYLAAAKAILSLGEEKMGEVVNHLLANEKFVVAVQTAITGSLQAKRTVDKSLARVLGFLNVPTTEDVDQVREKLMDLEESLAEIYERVVKLDQKLKTGGKQQADLSTTAAQSVASTESSGANGATKASPPVRNGGPSSTEGQHGSSGKKKHKGR